LAASCNYPRSAGVSSTGITQTYEAPLVDGLADQLRAAGLAAFGPSASAARLEVLALTPQRRLDVHVWDIPAQPDQ
jgi:hypothetical protein